MLSVGTSYPIMLCLPFSKNDRKMIAGQMEGDVEVELTFDSTNSNMHEEGTMKAFTALQGRARECEGKERSK